MFKTINIQGNTENGDEALSMARGKQTPGGEWGWGLGMEGKGYQNVITKFYYLPATHASV